MKTTTKWVCKYEHKKRSVFRISKAKRKEQWWLMGELPVSWQAGKDERKSHSETLPIEFH